MNNAAKRKLAGERFEERAPRVPPRVRRGPRQRGLSPRAEHLADGFGVLTRPRQHEDSRFRLHLPQGPRARMTIGSAAVSRKATSEKPPSASARPHTREGTSA